MISVSAYTIFTSFIMVNLFIIIFTISANSLKLLNKIPINWFIIFLLIIGIRLFFPVEFGFTREIQSYVIVPKILDFIGFNSQEMAFGMFLKFFILISLSGTLTLIYKYINSYRLLCRRIKCIENTKNQKYLDILHKVKEKFNCSFNTKLIVNSEVQCPLEFGFVKQTIMLPENLYDNEELEYILSHEVLHHKFKTTWLKAFSFLIYSFMWWNPLAKYFLDVVENISEIYCDTEINSYSDINERVSYLKCLIKAKYNSSYNHLHTISNSFTANITQKRFQAVLEMKKRGNSALMIATFLILLSCVFSYQFVIQPAYIPSEEHYDIPEITPHNSYLVKIDNELYTLYWNNEPILDCTSEMVNEIYPHIPIKNKKGDVHEKRQ